MTRARESLVSLEATPYYHCISRCVRRAWLCGEDPYTGQSFEHRRQWVLDRLRELTDIFAIDVCAYAILSNHFHVVLHIDAGKAKGWTDRHVIEQWNRLYKGHMLADRYLAGEVMCKAEWTALSELIETWRARLHDISWFMRCMNEHLALKANAEDQCKGRFWEGRFKSQALLDCQHQSSLSQFHRFEMSGFHQRSSLRAQAAWFSSFPLDLLALSKPALRFSFNR